MKPALLLAHQGGWDELLLVAAPIVIFVVLLKIANERAHRLEADTSSALGAIDGEPNASDPGADAEGGTS